MEIEEILQKIIDKKNRIPLENFDGFTPEEMYKIVYYPYSIDCPIHVNFEVDNRLLSTVPIFNIVIDLLIMIEWSKSLFPLKRLLATGFPSKVCVCYLALQTSLKGEQHVGLCLLVEEVHQVPDPGGVQVSDVSSSPIVIKLS